MGSSADSFIYKGSDMIYIMASGFPIKLKVVVSSETKIKTFI